MEKVIIKALSAENFISLFGLTARPGLDGIILFKGLGLIKSTSFASRDLPTAGVEPTTPDNGPLYKTNICAP